MQLIQLVVQVDTFVEGRTLNDTSYTLALKGRNRSGTQSTLDTQTVNLHTAGTFGQALVVQWDIMVVEINLRHWMKDLQTKHTEELLVIQHP